MGRALGEMVKAGGATLDRADERVEALERHVASVKEEVGALHEAMAALGKHQEEMEGRLAKLEESGDEVGSLDSTAEAGGSSSWTPPKRAHGLPDSGVVTLEEQPDEEHAFGPAVEMVAEWRRLRTGGSEGRKRVERARAEERRWELEVVMIGDFGLTLPPETEPLSEARRDDHLGWRAETLRPTRRERVRAEWLRRVLTLGLWWR